MADQNNLPEGTNSVIDDGTIGDIENETSRNDAQAGAQPRGEGAESIGESSAQPKSAFEAFKQAALDNTADLRSQAGDKARGYAAQGKDRASEALSNLGKMVSDAAGQVEEKIGPEYGGYARKAADAVNGAAESLRNKNVDDLIEDAKGYVKSSPALAIGLAAAVGFMIARVARAGVATDGADKNDAT